MTNKTKKEKILSLILGFSIVLTLFGCKEEVEYKQAVYNKPNIEIQETKIEQENWKDFTSGKKTYLPESEEMSKDNTLQNLNKGSSYFKDGKELTFRELLPELDERLKVSYAYYRKKEKLIFNYKSIQDKNIYGNYLTDELTEVREDETYYIDYVKRVGDTYKRTIETINYKNKAEQEYQVGRFSTKKADKKVKLEWTPLDPDEETSQIYLDKFLEKEEYDFSGLSNIYYFTLKTGDFKAKGKTNLRNFKTWTTCQNSGLKALKDIKAGISRTVIKDGRNVEQTIDVTPLDYEFDYEIEMIGDTIKLTADLTGAVNKYFELFPQYEGIQTKYELTLENKGDFPNEENIATSSNAKSDNNE